MGCVECKICKQEEEKNQFEYPNDPHSKILPNNIDNTKSSNGKIDNKNNISYNFFQEFEERRKLIGNYISENEFEMMIPEMAKNYIKNNSFPFHKKENSQSHKLNPLEFENGNIFFGQWNDNFEMEGYGKYFLKDEKVLAEGIWEKGELRYARIFYPNDEFYEGELYNSNYNGKGKLISQNKDEYNGDFVDGEKNGEGRLKFDEDGAEYNGQFKNNNFNGYGKMKWNNGIEYDGNFNENYLEGEGKLINLNSGEKYEGNFEKNLFHGKGKYTYINGDEYEGDFEYGIRKGKGIYKKKDGFIFEGLWDNNVPNGYGKITYNDNILKCNFHNGNIIDNPVCEQGGYSSDIDFNFYYEPMNLSTQKLSHIENNDVMSSQYKAGTMLSFLED